MNTSTEGVTLYSMFLSDVLKNYEKEPQRYQPLFKMADPYNLKDPFSKVPMQTYNEMCGWIEQNLGEFNLIRVGRNIGETVYTNLRQMNRVQANAKPVQILEELVKVAAEMVQDPHNRGWEIIDTTSKSVRMRRTQTFNSKLQIGLLDGLVRKSGVMGVKVALDQEVTAGAPFDEYVITWL